MRARSSSERNRNVTAVQLVLSMTRPSLTSGVFMLMSLTLTMRFNLPTRLKNSVNCAYVPFISISTGTSA